MLLLWFSFFFCFLICHLPSPSCVLDGSNIYLFLFQADTDKDGRLSLAEMIDNPYVFYSTVFSDEDDYDYHDELR